MIPISMKTSAPLTRQTIASINQLKVQQPKSSRDISTINQNPRTSHPPSPANTRPAPTAAQNRTAMPAPYSIQTGNAPLPFKPVPQLKHKIQKGQKVPLSTSGQPTRIKGCLGWNTTNADCDVDVSAFMLNSSGKVIGDSWFVFYGQTQSPDKSTTFCADEPGDRESITIDLTKVHSGVSKIVFVLTINEALEKNLNFSMMKDAYIRILDASNHNELVSFKIEEYYPNITSLMLGEVYRHNGVWKFNAIGNGVARDLAGLCEYYGVQVI